jgi:4-amino-4-deoxy-L-arabinose transferase-like glycosyltransferase
MANPARKLSPGSILIDKRRQHTVLIGLIIIAFALRMAVALVLPLNFRLQKDAVEYVTVANNILTNGIFGVEEGVPYAKIPPGYPLLIAAMLSISGGSLLAVRLAQVLLSVAAVWLTYLVGKEAFSAHAGLAAAAICTLYPPFIVYVAPCWTETLYTAIALLFILYIIHLLKNASIKNAALAGMGFGLSMLIKETLIAFPLALPISFWWTRFRFKKAIQYLAVFAAVALLILSPWLVRNYAAFGHIFYSSRTDLIRYQLTGTGYLAPEFAEQVAEQELPVSEDDDLYNYYQQFGRTSDLWHLNFLLGEPRTYLRYVFNRLVEFWLHPNGLQSIPEAFILRASYITAHVGMLGLAIWQITADLRKRDAVASGTVLLLLYLTAVGVFLRRPNPRYNLPFLPIVFVYAATGATKALDQFKKLWKKRPSETRNQMG